MENLNLEKLQELGIFELRNIAREVGVYSPTTLKKDEIIENIMRILNGEQEPHVKKTKQGRPPKTITNLNNLMDVIIPSKLFEEKQTHSKSFFNDLNESINVNIVGDNEQYFKSIIKVYNNNEYALAFLKGFKEDKKNVVFISNKQVELYNLKTGDEVAGKYVFLDEEKPYVLKEIISINNSSFSKNTERLNFNNLICNFPEEKIKLAVYKINDEIFNELDLYSPFAKGQRIILLNKNNDSLLNYEIVNRLRTGVNNLKGLAVLIDDMPENYYSLINSENLETLSNNFGNNEENFVLKLETKINTLLRKVEEGENLFLFINDINKLYNFLLNKYILEKKSIESAKIFAEEDIKKLILLGKFTNNGSLTIIFGCRNDEVNLNFKNKFISLFNNIVSYNKNNFKYNLNKEECLTFNIEKILTKSELQKLKK